MSTQTLSPILRAALGYAHIVAELPIADLMAGMADSWKSMRTAAFNGPRERIHIVHTALDLCEWTRKYQDPCEFDRSLSGLLRAAGLVHDAPEGKEWRRRNEESAWVLHPQGESITETPSIWSAKWVGREIMVPAIIGVTFENELYAISAGVTARRRCIEGHGNPVGAAFADRLDAVTASVAP